MARRALLVGINDYQSISDLRGCINDIEDMRGILKNYLGFTNNDIRVVVDSRATKQGILHRLDFMAKKAEPGDFMVFQFAGHGSQIRDRDGDERLEDGLDELLCPYDMDWDGKFILDDDLDRIFSQIPQGAHLEVFLDCCHSGTSGTRSLAPRTPTAFDPDDEYRAQRFLAPPPDIYYRYEGEEEELAPTRGFTRTNRSGTRSTQNHVLWAGCRSDQTAADAYFDGRFHGAFSYYFSMHMRRTGGNVSRRNLLDMIRNSLSRAGFPQVPQLLCPTPEAYDHNPLQVPAADETRRILFLTTPYMRGYDVKRVQQALADKGYRITADGVFGPHTREIVKQFQIKNNLIVDGVVGPEVYGELFK